MSPVGCVSDGSKTLNEKAIGVHMAGLVLGRWVVKLRDYFGQSPLRCQCSPFFEVSFLTNSLNMVTNVTLDEALIEVCGKF